MTDAEQLAAALLSRAEADEQTAVRLVPTDDADAIRAEIRSLARERGIRIRTSVTDGVLVIVRADAAIWHESTAVMRTKLAPQERPAS